MLVGPGFMLAIYRIVLYLCAAAFAVLVAHRLLRRGQPNPGFARRLNEAIWTLIPAVLLFLLVLATGGIVRP